MMRQLVLSLYCSDGKCVTFKIVLSKGFYVYKCCLHFELALLWRRSSDACASFAEC